MKTAVEWFVEEMFKQGYFNDKPMTVANINYFANIAKQMEKEQIKNAWIDGVTNWDSEKEVEDYINETFKSE